MTNAEKNTAIKSIVAEKVLSAIGGQSEDVIQVSDFTYAVKVEVDGEPRWCELNFVAKNNKATAVSDAYDPLDKADEWRADKEFKAKEKESKAKAKAEKIARSKAKREKVAAEKQG